MEYIIYRGAGIELVQRNGQTLIVNILLVWSLNIRESKYETA